MINITVDGGPGGLKTRAFKFIEHELISMGTKVIFVEESARAYFEINGRDEDLMVQQKGIFKLQLDNENKAREEAEVISSKGHSVLIWYDRSLMTSKGYLDKEKWIELIEHFNISENEIASRYDQPIHFVSAAVDVPHLYKNDKQRNENREQAKAIDFRLREIWYPYFEEIPIIGNLEGENNKFLNALKVINQHLKK